MAVAAIKLVERPGIIAIIKLTTAVITVMSIDLLSWL